MAKDKKTPLTIDGVDYNFEDLTPEQQVLVNHIADLDRKIAGSKFSLDQMQVGRDAFFAMLKTALEPKSEE
jgi:hypothetical protein